MKLDDFQILPIRVCDGDIEGILFNAIVPGVGGKTPTETASTTSEIHLSTRLVGFL